MACLSLDHDSFGMSSPVRRRSLWALGVVRHEHRPRGPTLILSRVSLVVVGWFGEPPPPQYKQRCRLSHGYCGFSAPARSCLGLQDRRLMVTPLFIWRFNPCLEGDRLCARPVLLGFSLVLQRKISTKIVIGPAVTAPACLFVQSCCAILKCFAGRVGRL